MVLYLQSVIKGCCCFYHTGQPLCVVRLLRRAFLSSQIRQYLLICKITELRRRKKNKSCYTGLRRLNSDGRVSIGVRYHSYWWFILLLLLLLGCTWTCSIDIRPVVSMRKTFRRREELSLRFVSITPCFNGPSPPPLLLTVFEMRARGYSRTYPPARCFSGTTRLRKNYRPVKILSRLNLV